MPAPVPAGRAARPSSPASSRALGVPGDQAREVAGMMVEADLLGSDTHGVFRLRQYVNRLRDGGYNPTPRIRVLRETAATALVDGDNGLGHLAHGARHRGSPSRRRARPASAGSGCAAATTPARRRSTSGRRRRRT